MKEIPNTRLVPEATSATNDVDVDARCNVRQDIDPKQIDPKQIDPKQIEYFNHVSRVLEDNRIKPTRQRVDVAAVLLARHDHLSADDVYNRLESSGTPVSRATVYNTLSLLVAEGILRQVIVDPSKVFYDSNTTAHHHVFDTETGRLTDIPVNSIEISRLPALPDGTKLTGIDVIVRVASTES